MRQRASAWVLTSAVALLIVTGCSAGKSGPSADSPGGGSSSTAAIKPLHVVSVMPRHTLKPTGTITVTFTTPLASNSTLPTLSPAVPGSWTRSGATAVFTPSQAYPPDQSVAVHLVKRPGGHSKLLASPMTPTGSLERAQQILARLHYLPLSTTAATATTAAEEADAVYAPPPGGFSWRYGNVPRTLKQEWVPDGSSAVLRGAVIAFQHHAGIPVDASVGPMTWAALIKADLHDKVDPHRYSYVYADLHIPQRLYVWVAGSTVITSPVNGGVSGAPTPLGTYPVYERFPSTTMSGTNPDGSTYKDPGVRWVNYFSGGSAVHGFPRASYGTPQSVGCLELPIPTAAKVYKVINYGTLVHVAGPQEAQSTQGAPAPPKPQHSG